MLERLRTTLYRWIQGPVSRVTIHHEGAGMPTDNVARFYSGGYSAAIGVTAWSRFRSPYTSYGTLGYNHVSVDICLSGNRMDYVVTDRDIELIRQCCADYRARGELVANPDVVFHHDSPGSSTVCPGTNTYAREAEVKAACFPSPPKPPSPKPQVEDQLIFKDSKSTSTAPKTADIDPASNIALGNGAKLLHGGTPVPTVPIGGTPVVAAQVPTDYRFVGAIEAAPNGFLMFFRGPNGKVVTREYQFG